MIRPYRLEDETRVRDIYAECHPGMERRPAWWFVAHPTLVALDMDEEVIGFTSFTLGPTDRGFVMYGADVCVLPKWQGKGIGRQLHELRLDIARNVGAQTFLGTTAPDNGPMLAIFARQGLVKAYEHPDYFGPGQPAVFYAGEVSAP